MRKRADILRICEEGPRICEEGLALTGTWSASSSRETRLDYGASTVTAMTIGAVASWPFTSSISRITSCFSGRTVR